MKAIEDICDLFDELTAAAIGGELELVANEKLTVGRRRFLSRLINSIDISSKTNWLPLEACFDRLVNSLDDKLTPSLFELILKIGLKLKSENDSRFWFSLITTFDYGVRFDKLEVFKILVQEVVKDGESSWKATCLLCILIQDYPSTISSVRTQLLSVVDRLNKILRHSSNYTLCCYLVELVSQIDDRRLSEGFASGSVAEIPKNCFANDIECQDFMVLSTSCMNSVATIETFTMEDIIDAKPGVCELTTHFLTFLIQTNNYVTPIEINVEDINNLERVDRKMSFVLSIPPSHALVTKVKFPETPSIVVTFEDNFASETIISQLYEKYDTHCKAQTPRKISVVETFIEINADSFGGQQSEDAIEDFEIEASKKEPHEEVPATNDTESSSNLTEHSEFTESSGKALGSHVNTTKDTTVFTNKPSRPISKIVAESTRDNIFGNRELTTAQSPTSSFAPDTLDSAHRKDGAKQNVSKESGQKSSSAPPAQVDDCVKERPYTRSSSADPWGFISDEDNQLETNNKRKSRAMKVFDVINKKSEIQKKHNSNESNQKAKKLNLKTSVSKIIVDTSRKEAPTIRPSSISQHDTLSGLTSPIIHAQRRASTRARSIILRESSIAVNNADVDEAASDAIDKQPSKRRRNQMKAPRQDDELIQPPQQAESAEPPKVNSKAATKPKVNIRKRKSAEEQDTPETLSQIFKSPEDTGKKRKTRSKARGRPAKVGSVAEVQSPSAEPDDPARAEISNQGPPLKQPDLNIANPSLHSFNDAVTMVSLPVADAILSEAYTNTLQRQIFESITSFSNQLVKKIRIINEEINKKVMNDLTTKYETLFNDLRVNFSNDVDQMCNFITDVKGLLNLPEEELVAYIKNKKIGNMEKQ